MGPGKHWGAGAPAPPAFGDQSAASEFPAPVRCDPPPRRKNRRDGRIPAEAVEGKCVVAIQFSAGSPCVGLAWNCRGTALAGATCWRCQATATGYGCRSNKQRETQDQPNI